MLRRRRQNTPVTVAVTPTTASLTHPDTQQFTAATTNIHGTDISAIASGDWTTSDAAKATVDAAGLSTTVADVILSGLTATGGSATTIVDTGQTWVVNVYAGKSAVVTAGTNVGETRLISSNTADTLTTAAFSGATDATTVYSITNGGSGDTDIDFTALKLHDSVTDATPAVLTVSP